VGARSPQLEPLLAGAAGSAPAGATTPQRSDASPAPVPACAAPPAGLRLPPPRVSALLVLVFLGFGVLLGNAASSRVPTTLASARSPLKVVLSPSKPATSSTATPQLPSSPPPSEPSSPEGEPTPSAPAKTTSARKQSTANGGSSGSQGGSSGSEGRESSKSSTSAPAKKLPPIKHVFVIALSDEPYASVFGPSSTAPYLSGKLEHQGELLVHYDAVAHEELADEVALLSGQGPTAETAANCSTYTEISATGVGADEQVLGSGCVYPRSTQTLAGQLVAKRLTWRAYVQGIDEAGTQAPACAHPALAAADPTADQSSSNGAYATFRNPFVYFDSIVDTPECATNDVGLEALQGDLAHAKRTPSFSYIVPDRCHDGNPTPCTPGAPVGVAQTDAFLERVVPEITASKAYKESGLLVITVDQAPSSGELADSSSCCGQPLFPNAPSRTLAGAPRGGGAVGALLLSPYVKGGTTNEEPFNHFSLLRTIEDLFGLGHLGYAGLPAVKSFEPAMFTAGKG
jgi:phosphatidylinositol-3-phosphatase